MTKKFLGIKENNLKNFVIRLIFNPKINLIWENSWWIWSWKEKNFFSKFVNSMKRKLLNCISLLKTHKLDLWKNREKEWKRIYKEEGIRYQDLRKRLNLLRNSLKITKKKLREPFSKQNNFGKIKNKYWLKTWEKRKIKIED